MSRNFPLQQNHSFAARMADEVKSEMRRTADGLETMQHETTISRNSKHTPFEQGNIDSDRSIPCGVSAFRSSGSGRYCGRHRLSSTANPGATEGGGLKRGVIYASAGYWPSNLQGP